MAEEWKPCFEGHYEASSEGRIRRSHQSSGTRAGKLLGQHNAGGYLMVVCSVKGKANTKKVHRLVAAAFLGPCPSGLEVNHIDGIKSNNSAVNLEYVTRSRNQRHARALGLFSPYRRHPQSTIDEIRRLYSQGLNFTAIAAVTGGSRGYCGQVAKNKSRA